MRLACERHFADKRRARDRAAACPYKFDPASAERVAIFCELFPHTKGRWASKNEPFRLEPWQCFMVLSIYGWVYKRSGLRRFRQAMLVVPRKNGKSDFAARLGNYHLAADGEFGAEVFSGATSENQAWEVFRPARLMAERTPAFREHYGVEVMKSRIVRMADGSRFEPVIAKPGDGSSPSCAIVDEYHEHLDDTQYDTMATGMGAREQPLMLVITTAGDNLGGPCYQLQLDLQKILEGAVENDQFWGIVYTVDANDDWASEAALKKANPNYGVSIDAEFLAAKQSEAIRNARKQGIFQTKHLNVWMGSREAFFNIKSWQKCARPGLKPEDLKGQSLFVGIDLASTVDIAAVVLLFRLPDGEYATFGRFYIPESRIEGGANEHYRGWMLEGKLIVTEGDMIDYDEIEQDILDVHREYGIRQLAFDPAYAQMLVQHLMAKGISCIDVRPVTMNFSQPMKLLDGLIQAGKIRHDGDPAMTWMMSNVTAKIDSKDNVYPNKERAEAKIDGPVALIMAMNRALAHADVPVQMPQIFAV